MTQPDADTTETRLQQLTGRFDSFAKETRDFMDETRDFMEETRRNREADTKRFDEFVEETRGNQKANEQRFDDFTKEVRDEFARLRGREYERMVCHTLLSPVSHRIGLRRPRLVHSVAYGTREELRLRLEDLMEDDDLMEVTLSDAIVRGTHQGAPAYAVVEISITIGDRDITRAADRAQKLQAASKVRAFPVAIGQHIPEPQQNRANNLDVTLIQISE